MKKAPFMLWVTLSFFSASAIPGPENYTYAVVISTTAYADAAWKAVADSLVAKHKTHNSRLFTWTSSVGEVKSGLSGFMPTYIGFIARPAVECNSTFIVAISQLSRSLDNDPYVDAAWGVITGFTASDALRAISESIAVKTVVLGSNGINYEPPLMRFYQGVGMPCESYTKTDYLFPNLGGKVYSVEARPNGANDRTAAICGWLNAATLNISVAGQGTITGAFDCLITGGHGNVNVWQMHYSDAGTEGYLKSSNGQLFGAPYSGATINVNSPTPKIYWCLSNCLMGCPDNVNNFVYAAFHTGHAVQMFGFVPNAHAGDEFMAWGMYDRISKFAGKYTFAQGFFISQNDAQFEVLHPTGQFNSANVKCYFDSCAFYGDPAANVTFSDFGDSTKPYTENLSYTTNAQGTTMFTYTITTTKQSLGFGVGYCYAFRPVLIMPVRIDASTVSIIKNDGHTADISDNLVVWEILSTGESMKTASTKTLSWSAKILGQAKVSLPAEPTILPPTVRVRLAADRNSIVIVCSNVPAGPMVVSIVTMNGKKLYGGTIYESGGNKPSVFIPPCPISGVNVIVMKGNGIDAKAKLFLP
jgi:hypothetical protein